MTEPTRRAAPRPPGHRPVSAGELDDLRRRLSVAQLIELERPLVELGRRLADVVIERDYGSRGGRPPGRLEVVVDQVVALRVETGDWPTQEEVAERLDVSDRSLRKVGRWRYVLALAAEQIEDD